MSAEGAVHVGRKRGGFGQAHGGLAGVAGWVLADERSWAADHDADDLAHGLAPVVLPEGEAKHCEVDAGVGAKPRVATAVCSLEGWPRVIAAPGGGQFGIEECGDVGGDPPSLIFVRRVHVPGKCRGAGRPGSTLRSA